MKSGICILICLVFIIACSVTGLQPVDKGLEATLLPFIKDGKTTKEEIMLKYGSPTKTFTSESSLIYIYNIRCSNNIPECHLVLVFDEHNILKRHSFLKVR
jgi:hypothetical protein